MLPIFINILVVINVLVCLLLVLLTLMQRPKNEGLGAAFGGGMTENLFGADTTNVLVKGTRLLGGLFLGITLLLSFLVSYQANSPSSINKRLAEQAASAKATASATPAASSAPASSASPASSATPAAPVSPAK